MPEDLSLPYKKKRGPNRQSVFWYNTDYCILHKFCIENLVSYQKKDWQDPACQSFFWYDNDKDL